MDMRNSFFLPPPINNPNLQCLQCHIFHLFTSNLRFIHLKEKCGLHGQSNSIIKYRATFEVKGLLLEQFFFYFIIFDRDNVY